MLAVADQLVVELGYPGAEIPAAHSDLGGEHGPLTGTLDSEDELLVAHLRRSLAKLAAALDSEGTGDGPRQEVGGALDGVELVLRGELINGNLALLPTLMPGFVFLVALSVVDQDKALELSKRTRTLVGEHRIPGGWRGFG
jgi:hypothetical protein